MVQRQRPRPHPGPPAHRPHPGPPAHRPHPRPPAAPRDTAETTHGLRAGIAVVARRPDDVLRVAFTREVRGELGDVVRACAARRIPCEEASGAELERIAESAQHEGLCVSARARRWLSTGELADVVAGGKGTALALDRVRNPYNVGAILRSAAFFGVDAMLLGTPAPHPGLAPTAVRVAEGGAEHVRLARTTDLADTLARLRGRGVRVVGADGGATTGAAGFSFGRPVVLVVGNEREGLGERVRAQCDAVVGVRGTGSIESLNVAVASGVLVAEMTRRA
ncbi:MAG TPA: RNA methyltransferase, partial [Polyangiaceae bacterium]|nr:RNA methyltransferase [Polyangiaceae bacterium]